MIPIVLLSTKLFYQMLIGSIVSVNELLVKLFHMFN